MVSHIIPIQVRHAMQRVYHVGSNMTDTDFQVLFDYYTQNNQMPYGVAKARTGDPYEWIARTVREVFQ
jgi:hypothetical protein